MFHLLLCAAAVLAIAQMLVNAFYMLFSPRKWFGLPRWMRVQGMATRSRNADGSGALKLRVLGALIIGVSTWIAYDFFSFVLRNNFR